MTPEVDVLYGQYAARLELAVESKKSRPGITKVGKNKADIDEIIPVIRRRGSRDILHPEVYILNSDALCFLLSEQDLRTIKVDACNMPLWHHAAEREGYVSTTTSHIQA